MSYATSFLFVTCIGLFFLNSCVFAQQSKEFRVSRDGTIDSLGETFGSMRAYVNSKAFKDIGGRCATDRMTKRFPVRKQQEGSREDCTEMLTVIKDEYSPDLIITIPIWFHVIQQSSTVGSISSERINQQIQVMNEDFQALNGTLGATGFNTKLNFVLAGTTTTINADWYSDSDADELTYKTALHKDTRKYLNVYANDARGYLGYAYFPTTNAGVRDGVVMLSDSIGGRNNSFSPYNQGRTLVHEVGHYLGLHHTFNGGSACENTFSTGDLVVDTNAETSPYYGDISVLPSCPQRSTCGTLDPTDNYMDYNIDYCMTRFTEQQANRMTCSLINYRPDFVSIENKDGNIVPILDYLLN